MNKNREELVQKLMREMMNTFRTLSPRSNLGQQISLKMKMQFSEHAKEGEHEHKFGSPWLFGHRHMGLLHRLKEEKEGISVKELAEDLHVTSGAITQIVDPLVERGFLERAEDKTDRRILRIKLSESAREKFKGFREKYLASVGPKLDNLTDSELTELSQLLAKINSKQEEQ